MTQGRKWRDVICAGLLSITCADVANASSVPAVESVMWSGFPAQPDQLAIVTSALFKEYGETKNVVSLIFYAWGVLRQAENASAVNDFINASEYAKTGFFYLDEAIDSHEDNLRVRYMRARVDAWLAPEMGRCAVTIKDTEWMLKDKTLFNPAQIARIQHMRYLALYNCKKSPQAAQLLAQIKRQDAAAAKALELHNNVAPAWDENEVAQVLLPLVKGE